MNVVEIGNPRKLATWQEHLQSISGKYLSEDFPDPYFFFALSTLGLPNPEQDNQLDEEAMVRGLKTLAKFNDAIHTVFKPHAVTDIERFSELLKECGYKNYTIANIHPSILARKAVFTIVNYSSTVLVDASLTGCPTIDFVRYDSRGSHVINGESLLKDFVDYFIEGDVVELENTVQQLLADNAYRRPDTQIDRFSIAESQAFPIYTFVDLLG